MRKLGGFVVLVAIGLVAYSIFSNPEKREKFFGAIENSTGLDLENDIKPIMKKTGESLDDTAEKLLQGLDNTLSDPEFRLSVERWGKDALEKLNKTELRQLQKDLKKELERGTQEFNKIFEQYLTQ